MKKNFILVFFMMLCSFAFSQNAGQTSYDWGEFDYHDYPASKQVYAVINMDGNEVTNQNFEIAPFCGDQLRGKAAKPIFYGDNYGYIYTFSVFGNLGDEITFKLYDYATGTLYDNVATENMVWNETPTGSIANPYTLHFASVAEVANVKYGSLAKAVEKATSGATVKVINNVTLSEGLVVNKSLTFDLNGKAITAAANVYPVIRVQGGASVTVNGEGSITNATDYVFTLGASDGSSAGDLTIKNGTFHGATTVASVTKGNLVIEGGKFSVEPYQGSYAYLINCKDEYYSTGDAKVSIKGGTFHKWNPEDNAAEGEGTDFCVEGYIAVYDAANETYTVQEGLVGEGTETEPFIIRNLRDLVFFRDHVNAGKTTYNAEGVHVALGANIDMASVDWSVNIGDDCNYTFDGIFDGKGFTLSNLNSEETAQKADGYICTGLFGAIAGNAVVKNLTIENVNIEATYTGNNAAAVVGFVYTGANKTAVIENVTVKGDVKINASGVYGVGAIVGYSLEKSGNVNIKNCVVDAKEGSKITAISGVGAIIGHAAGIVAIEGSSVNNIDITAKGLVGGVAGLVSSGKSVLSNNTVMNVALTATEPNWVNSAAIAVGTMNKDGLTVANTTFENVNVSQMVGSVYANKPTSVVPAVEARIDDVYYTKFDNALAAAEGGNTITVLNPVVITENKTYELADINVEGDVYPMFRIQNGATVTFDGGNFKNGDYVFTLGEGKEEAHSIGNLVINGGKYHGETTVANVVKGLLTINGGVFSADPAPEEYGGDYRYLINCYDATYNNVANVEITGGTFYNWDPENNAAEGAGTNFCAEGYTVVYNDMEKSYTVVKAVAKIDETYYATLSAAVEAAQENKIVKLLDNATGAGVVIDKDVTIDFAGFTYSLNEPVGSSNTVSNGLQILAGNNVTLMNGTLKVADDAANKFYILVQNYANLTVEGMILEGENLDKYSFTDGDSYVLSNNSGNVNIINTNIKANLDGNSAFAFDVCDSESYTVKPVVYVKGNDTRVEGRIEVSATIEENLHIQGGTYDFDVEEAGYCDNAYFTKDNGNDTWTVEGPYVAQIGETRYATLAKAISAATAGQTITLIANVTEDVTVKKNLTIDGAENNYTGNISVTGKNINVTVKNVNFINGTGYAITTNTIGSITVENCTVKDYGYGFLYANKTTPTVVVKNVTVDGGNYGMHWVYGSKATLENVTMTNVANGLFIQNYASKTITVKNSNISSIAIWERDGSSGVQTFKFEGANTVGTLSASQYAKYILPATDATLTAPEGHVVTTTVEGYVAVWNAGVYSVQEAVAQIGDNYYASIQEAIDAAESGDEIVLLVNINLDETALGLLDNQYSTYFKVEGKTITIDLNGKTISGEFNSTPMLVGLFSTENNGHLTLVDNSEEGTALVDLKSRNDQVYALIVNYEPGCSITIDGGTYKLDKAKDAIVYTGASLNEGGVKIEDGIFELGNVGTGPSNGQPWIFNVKGQNNRGVQVNGGTFNADINHQYWANEVYVPETLALQNNGDDTWTVVNAVAYVEEKATSTGAEPRNVGYASLADAVKAKGTTVTVIKEHVTTTTAVVEKDMTIDFAGLAITGDIYPVVRIQNNANVTVKNGNITNGDYVFTLGSENKETAGNLTIEDGTYVGETTVASVTKGNLVIKDGEFKISDVDTYNYAYFINCLDESYNNGTATVAISGGTFHNWNPENNAAEGAGTNFCAAGYSAVETATGSNIWTVVPAQVQKLAQGWNWYSSYVEADNLLDQLKAGIDDKGVMIKNHLGKYVQYESQSGWIGNLSSVSVTEMYMINNNDDVAVAVFGNIVDPSKEENAITIQSKWNWIGYPLTEEMSVSLALNDLAATDGDIIKAHDGSFSTYIEGYGWTSGLNKLEPRNGYMYYSYAEDGKEFNYSYPRSKEAVKANVTSANNYWVSNVSSFATNMTMMAVLSVDGNEMKEGVEVAAFVNGEVRGSARPVYVDAIDRYVLFMSICGEDGEEVSFKYVDLYTEEEYAIDNKVVYSENAIIGTVRDLYELVCGTMGIGENAANAISIYPNPTTTNTAISFETVCDMVEVFNSLGAKVAEYSNVDRIDGVETAGVYVIRVTNGSTVQNCRLIVK